jgi:hypothetical protein
MTKETTKLDPNKPAGESRPLLEPVFEVIGTLPPGLFSKTLGGRVFWEDVDHDPVTGLRLQKNWVFGQYRVLDGSNHRVVSGGRSVVIRKYLMLVAAMTPIVAN